MDQIDRPSRILNATAQVLRPLVRFLLKNQLTYAALLPLLKQLYVEVADEEFALDGKRQTESRLSLLTGIHRKEVKRLRQEVIPAQVVPVNLSLGGQLVAAWLATPGYHENGEPVAIPRQSLSKDDVSFETLVETVGHQDIRPRAVLDEWLRLGIARINQQDEVELLSQAYVPARNEEEKLFYWQRNLADHIETASQNMDVSKAPKLERSVYYSQLSESAIAELESYYRQESMVLLKKMNDKARALKQTHPGDQRMNAGVYFASAEIPQEKVCVDDADQTGAKNLKVSKKPEGGQ